MRYTGSGFAVDVVGTLSTSGNLFNLGGSSISCKSKEEAILAHSMPKKIFY